MFRSRLITPELINIVSNEDFSVSSKHPDLIQKATEKYEYHLLNISINYKIHVSQKNDKVNFSFGDVSEGNMTKEMKTQANNNTVKTTRNKDVLQHVSHNNLSPDDLSIIYSSMFLENSRKRGLLPLT